MTGKTQAALENQPVEAVPEGGPFSEWRAWAEERMAKAREIERLDGVDIRAWTVTVELYPVWAPPGSAR